MIVGFTGSRHGMTQQQKNTITALLISRLRPSEVHHGVCVGSDAQFHAIVQDVLPDCAICGHSPINQRLMAQLSGFTIVYPPLEYHARDRAIVNSSDILLATPNSYSPQPHSGTWFTIHYAKDKAIIIYPDGTLSRTAPSHNHTTP